MDTLDTPEPRAEPDAGASRRRFWMLAAKIVVTAALVVWIADNTDWSLLGRTVVEADPWMFWLAIALTPFGYILSAHKWQLLLAVHGVRMRWLTLLRHYFVATFYNNFLPSSIGGDGYRIYKTLDNSRSRTTAVLAVFIDRLTGIFGLLIVLVAATGIMVWWDSGDELSRLVLITTCGIIVGVLAYTRIIGRLVRHPRCPAKLKALWDYHRDYRQHLGLYVATAAVTFLFHGVLILFCWLLVRAMKGGASAEILQIAIIQGLTALVGMIPVTINGLGLMDGSFSGLVCALRHRVRDRARGHTRDPGLPDHGEHPRGVPELQRALDAGLRRDHRWPINFTPPPLIAGFGVVDSRQ